jgi:endonuclease/exonuclease/phosphatase family metal-dependent hydrolase
VLSRLEPAAVFPHPDLKFPYFGGSETVKRGLLELTFATPAGGLTLFVVHLKSRYTDRSDDPESAQRRAGEAEAVRDYVLQRFPDPAVARFLILGDCNDVPGSRPLQLLTQRDSTRIAEMLPAADPQGKTWTYTFRKTDLHARVDYVLVSPGAKAFVRSGAARVYDGPGVSGASDHRPAGLRLADFSNPPK